jgi:flagellar protein FliS
MSPLSANNPYLESKFLTASPQRLQYMLLDGAVRFAKQAGEHWKQNDFEQGGDAMDRCEAILTEILKNIRVEQWEVAQSIAALYLFLRNLAIEAHLAHDQERLAKLVTILEVERETWRAVCEPAVVIDAPAAEIDTPASEKASDRSAESIIPPMHSPTTSAGFSIEA